MAGERKKGFALIIVSIMSSLMLALASGFILSFINDNSILKSQTESIKTYYIAEAGIQEAIWKLQNDVEWSEEFKNNLYWQELINRANIFSPGSEYSVEIKNLDLAQAEIISTGIKKIDSIIFSKRVIKTKVYKSIQGGSGSAEGTAEEIVLDGAALIAGNLINVWGIDLDVSGSVFSNGNIDVKLWSNVDASQNIKAAGEINQDWSSIVTVPFMQAENINPPAPEPLAIPAARFDSVGDAQSLKAKAQSLGQVYSPAVFRDMLDANPNFSAAGAVYITGNFSIARGDNLIIKGALASDGSIAIGNDWQWWDPCSSDDAKITVNRLEGEPSGIFSKNQISIKTCVGEININGIVFAGTSLFFNSLSKKFSIEGVAIARDIEGTGLWKPIQVSFNQEIASDSLGNSGDFAPLINLDHWEEEY